MATMYAIFFSGGLNDLYNYPRYKNDLERAANAFVDKGYITIQNIKILHADGSKDFTVGSTAIRATPACKSDLISAINDVSSKINSDDGFLFFASNHGGRTSDGTSSTLYCWAEDFIDSSDFYAQCSSIKSENQIYVFGQCHSGGFIPTSENKDKLVITACLANESSWSSSDLKYDEFLLRFIEQIEGGATKLNDIFIAAKAADTRQDENPQISSSTAWAGDLDSFA